MAAVQEAAYPITDDYNAARREGFGRLQVTIADGKRMSAARAYLRPAMRRGNVEVRVNAQATRIFLSTPRSGNTR